MYENKTPKNIKNKILNDMNINTQEGSFVSDMITPISIEFSELWGQYNKIISMLFLQGLQGEYLDAKASEYGIFRKTEIIDNETIKENDEQLKIRLISQIRSPAASGNIADYKKWCTEIANIVDAKVIPLWNGNGTVKIIPITTDKKSPTNEKLQEIINNIEKNRPIGADVTVAPPAEVEINVNIEVVLKSGCDLEQAKQKYTKLLNKYLQESVFKLSTVDYYRCLSFLYDLEEIQSVSSFKLNNNEKSIAIENTEIQVLRNVVMMEVS